MFIEAQVCGYWQAALAAQLTTAFMDLAPCLGADP
jgi:hypothetical protein